MRCQCRRWLKTRFRSADREAGETKESIATHLTRSRTATARDWTELLAHFTEQCEPEWPSELRPVRSGRVPDGSWEGSREYHALADMLGRCWPSERSQHQ